jgi:hypothetical protein
MKVHEIEHEASHVASVARSAAQRTAEEVKFTRNMGMVHS